MDVETIKKIMRTKTYLTLVDIKVITGCSSTEARRLRCEALMAYLPLSKKDKVKTKVRLDKFLEYYDNKELLELYHKMINGTI